MELKQLDAYNYFTSGCVYTVDLRNTSECGVKLKALVNPSQKILTALALGSDQEIWRYSGSPLGEGGGRVKR